jgi:hypothetical protein
MLALPALSACQAPRTEVAGVTLTERAPLWITDPGQWAAQWNTQYPDESGRVEWVVGASEPVASRADEAAALRLATDNAVDNLMRLLGVETTTGAPAAAAWNTRINGMLAWDIYRRTILSETAARRVSFSRQGAYLREMAVRSADGESKACVAYVLYRLDKEQFREQQILARAQAELENMVRADGDLPEATKKAVLETARGLAARRPDFAGSGTLTPAPAPALPGGDPNEP